MQQHQQQQGGSSSSSLPPHSEDVDEELRRIQMALAAVFSPTPPTDWTRQLADRYLVSFQSTTVAWMVCDRLLSSPDLNHRFFAAQTLLTKCRTDIEQLPADSHPSLRDSLVTHISAPSQSPVVITRLSMAVAALAVQMGWTTIVTDILQTHNATLIQSVLQALPEECASDRLVLRDENRRYQMRDHLIESAPLALQEASGLDLWHAWIRYVPIPPRILANSVVPDLTLQALQSPETMELAIDVIVELLRMYPSHILVNHELVAMLLPKLLALPVDIALNSDDEDVVRGYCRIMTELGESYSSIVCETPSHPIVERVLKCTSIEDTDIASMTLHFWYRFTTDLENTEPLRRRQDLVDAYTPHLLQLLDTLLKHLQYPSDLEELSPDRTDDLHRDRYYIGDTLEDCCRLLGGHTVLARIGQHFPNPIKEWHPVEACLFGIQSIHRYIPQDESQYLPHVMNLLPQLPPDIMPLRFTASATIGRYAPWLAAHPSYLQPLLPYLAEGLTRPECARAASVAIKELCELISLGDSVLQLYSQVHLDLSDELELLEGVCRTVSRQNANDYLARIVQPLGTRWSQELENGTTPVKIIVAEVERLTVIIRFLQVGGPALLEVMKSSWTLMDQSAAKFIDFRVAESICRLHKHALRTITASVYAPLLDSLMQFLVSSFDRSRQSPYLYAASICISEYGRDPTCTARLLAMVEALAQTTFGFLQSLQDFVLHPDVVEELFYLMGRMMNYCPGPLLSSPLLPSLYQCAVVGMRLDHRDANRGTLNFLEAAVGAENSSLPPEPVVTQLVQTLVGELPAYSIDSGSGSVAGILWKVNKKYPQPLRQWMASALEARAPARQRDDLLRALDTSRDREEFNAAIRAFRSGCERHRKLQTLS